MTTVAQTELYSFVCLDKVMASNPPESNTNKNTEWTSADDEISSTVELKNPKPYANIDFTEEVDAVVFHPQRTEGQFV